MHISAQKFVKLWTDQGGTLQNLYDSATVINALVKKRGSKLTTESAIDTISKQDQGLAGVIVILKRLGFLKTDSLKHIMSLCGNAKTAETYTISSSLPDRLGKLGQGDAVIKKQAHVGLTVAGDGKIYKRTLQGDLDKLI